MFSRSVSGETRPRVPAVSQPLLFPRDYRSNELYRFPALGISTEMQCISKRLSLSQSSLSKCNRAFAETSNPVRGLNPWIWSKSSVAASSAAADPEPDPDDVSPKVSRRSTKRISKAERKLLLESFVNSYRAMNSGKYPTTTEAQKEIGGGYYSVKKIIQEIEYKNRTSSTSLTRQSVKVEVEEKKEHFKVKNIVEEDVSSREVQLSGQEALATRLPLNEDVSGVTFAEEKVVSETTNLSCQEDPVSDSLITDEENVKSDRIDSNDIASLTAGENPFKGDASVLDPNNFSDNNVTLSTSDAKADDIISNSNFSSEEPEDMPLTPEISENKKEKVPIDDHHIESPKSEVSPRSDFCYEEPKVAPSAPDISEDMKENVITADIHQEESPKIEEPLMSNLPDEEVKVVSPEMEISSDMKEKTTIGGHQLELPKTEEPVRDINDEESPKKSFTWSLKSIADGIVNFWRKL